MSFVMQLEIKFDQLYLQFIIIAKFTSFIYTTKIMHFKISKLAMLF